MGLFLSRTLCASADGRSRMLNASGEVVDLYIPRKCAWTSKLIPAKDHASVQLNIGHLDEAGVYTGEFSTIALAGKVRVQGMADSAVDHLWRKMSAQAGQSYGLQTPQ